MIRRILLAVLLLGSAVPAESQTRRGFTCTAEAKGSGLQARTERLLDRRGELRGGSTTIDLPLAGGGGSLRASWEVERGLPEVARGRYHFRLPAAPDGSWQLESNGKPVRARAGTLTLGGEQFSTLLAGESPIQLVLAGRDGQVRGRRTLDAAIFAAALDLVRQSDARALAKSADLRGLCAPER